MVNITPRKLSYAAGFFACFVVVFHIAHAAGTSTTPPVTPPYDVNATIPGEGYQGFPGPYGGRKILQYCYFDRMLGEPKAGKTMYFDFKACAPDSHPLSGVIHWGDGSADTKLSNISCGDWRVPHIYKQAGSYSANIVIEGETCEGKKPAAPAKLQSTPPCTQGVICTCYSSAICPSSGGCNVVDKCDKTKNLMDVGSFTINGTNVGKGGVIPPNATVTFFYPGYPTTTCSLDQGQPPIENGGCLITTSLAPLASKLAQVEKNSKEVATNNLALASTAVSLQQKNYSLLAEFGLVLLAAAIGIGYIIRKLD